MKRTHRAWDASTYVTTYMDAIAVLNNEIVPKILSQIPLNKGARVLECGIGSGKWSAAFALLGYYVYAMDNSAEMLARAKANFPNILIDYILKDIREPNLIHPPVDMIFNEGVIEHFLDDEERKQVLTNFYEAVKGYISLIVPYKNEAEDEILYTRKKLREEIEEVGFTILGTYDIVFLSSDRVTLRKLIGINAQKQKVGGINDN